MGLTTNYLVKTTEVDAFLDTIKNAQAPEKFTYKFLQDLGYKSSNDRLYIGMLKSLGFLDDSGVPTTRYYNFLDPEQSNEMLKEGLEEAYEDLFAINVKAYDLSFTEVKGKLKSLTQGSKSDSVYSNMARTFKAFTDLVDWSTNKKTKEQKKKKKEEPPKIIEDDEKVSENSFEETLGKKINSEFHYNIQIHLPVSRDSSVYDAIFQSLKKHLFNE